MLTNTIRNFVNNLNLIILRKQQRGHDNVHEDIQIQFLLWRKRSLAAYVNPDELRGPTARYFKVPELSGGGWFRCGVISQMLSENPR